MTPLDQWLPHSKPLVVAGPCAAESFEQVWQTAKQLSGVAVFRAGLWKPRTRPGGFEGVGEEGLHWLAEVKSLGFLVATEVARAEHVEMALAHGVDVLWLGARTTVNPFSVQEIAEALKGSSAAVMVKNPLAVDLGLWIGALERVERAGISKLLAVHRGFANGEPSPYRHPPVWSVPLELKRRTGVPVLCDPSHIAGRIDKMAPVCQTALMLDMDGFMIESHINPPEALCDADQQLTPVELGLMLDSLKGIPEDLGKLRCQIDDLDRKLMEVLRRRFRVVEKIAGLKRARGMDGFQEKRLEQLMKHRTGLALEMGFRKEFIQELHRLIHRESLDCQARAGGNRF